MTDIEALAAAEAHAAETAHRAARALAEATEYSHSGEVWETYRIAAGRATEARAAAGRLAERLTGKCISCGVRLTPGTAGNVAACDFHDQTCDGCDAALDHPHGRAA